MFREKKRIIDRTPNAGFTFYTYSEGKSTFH